MLQKLIKTQKLKLLHVFFDEKVMRENNKLMLFMKVARISSFRYAIYQALELLLTSFLMFCISKIKRNSLKLPKEICRDNNIQFSDFTKKNLNHISDKIDIIFCFRFSKILKSEILNLAKIKTINFHGSLLPKYAGLGSTFQALKNEDNLLGGSFHEMTNKIDGGKIFLQKTISVNNKKSVCFHHIMTYLRSSCLIENLIDNMIANKSFKNDAMENEYNSFSKKDVRSFKKSLIKIEDIF